MKKKSPLFVEVALSALLDLGDALHGTDGCLHQLAIISDGSVALSLKVKDRVCGHFLAAQLAEGLCPADLAGVALHLEVAVAFGAAEAENLFCLLVLCSLSVVNKSAAKDRP